MTIVIFSAVAALVAWCIASETEASVTIVIFSAVSALVAWCIASDRGWHRGRDIGWVEGHAYGLTKRIEGPAQQYRPRHRDPDDWWKGDNDTQED